MSGAFMIHKYYSYIIYYIIHCIPFALQMSGAFMIHNYYSYIIYYIIDCIPFAL